MDRYTIHEHEGVRFVNLSTRDIVTLNGDIFPAEATINVTKDRSRADYGEEFSSPTRLKTRSSLLFNNTPANIAARHVYIEGLTFTELIHLPHPGELEWIASLPEDVLVIASAKVAQTYGYPVCMFRRMRKPDGDSYHIIKSIVWCQTP